MKGFTVSFTREMVINLGDYNNVRIGAPFPTATVEDGDDAQLAYDELKAMNLAQMRKEVEEVTVGFSPFIRKRALAQLADPAASEPEDSDA